MPVENRQRRPHGHLVGAIAKPAGQIANGRHHLLGVARQIAQQQIDISNQLDRRVTSFNKKLLYAGVGIIEQQLAYRRFSISARPASLLIVGFERTRDIEMRDEAQIRAIDAHTKRIGRDHDVALALFKLILSSPPRFILDATMIIHYLHAPRLELLGDLFDAFAGGAINDPGLMLAD